MPFPRVLTDDIVHQAFEDQLVALKKIVRRQARRIGHREEAERLVEAIVTGIRSRWDNASSMKSWFEWGGREQSAVGQNYVYAALANLGFDLSKVLHSLARAFGHIERPLGIIDDTSIRKYGMTIDAISQVHLANVPGGVAGHNVVTLLLSGPLGEAFYDCCLKVNRAVPRKARRRGRPRDDVRAARESTKHELALEMIDTALAKGVDFDCLLFDCWYFCAEIAAELKDRELAFISKAKKNYPFILDGEEITAGEFQARCQSWKRVRQTDHFFYQTIAELKNGVQVKVVATWFFRGKSLKKSQAVLVTSELHMSGAAIVLLYLERWRTEQAYKMLKHHLAWGNYHVTDFSAVQTYQKLGLLAYTLAKAAQVEVEPAVGLPTLLKRRQRAARNLMATEKALTASDQNHDRDSIRLAA